MSEGNSNMRAQGAGAQSSVLSWLAWFLAIAMVALLGWILIERINGGTQSNQPSISVVQGANAEPGSVSLPAFEVKSAKNAIPRLAALRTIIPTRPRENLEVYTVDAGDSIFGIAQAFNVKPETILWSNYDVLNDDPHMIEVGLRLRIPAVDGVLYKWAEGDTIEKVAQSFNADPNDILTWPANQLDIVNPTIAPDSLVMIPGGEREFRQWVVPTIARGPAGVNTTILGPGSCDTGEGGAYGTGTFIWPAGNTYLSGNDFWSGHLAIDIAAGTGAPIYATDSGVVVYAGAISGGYGNMVMIDHGNGYQSLYAHLSVITTRCGNSIYQGQTLGQAGSTGRSTGPHLHFEIRYFGSFVNPWQVLP